MCHRSRFPSPCLLSTVKPSNPKRKWKHKQNFNCQSWTRNGTKMKLEKAHILRPFKVRLEKQQRQQTDIEIYLSSNVKAFILFIQHNKDKIKTKDSTKYQQHCMLLPWFQGIETETSRKWRNRPSQPHGGYKLNYVCVNKRTNTGDL